MPVFRPYKRLRKSRVPRTIFAAVVALAVLSSALPSDADLSEEIEKLKEERAELQEQRETQAQAIDVSTAEANELAAALAGLNGQVNSQEDKLEQAKVQLAAAEGRFDDASDAVERKIEEINDLKGQVSERAISAWVDQNVGSTPVLENTNPNQAVRMQSLVQSVTRQEVDVAEQLKEAREDLALEEALAARATEDAEQFRSAIASELEVLEGIRDQQAVLLNEAETRLEAQLYEAAVMAERDKEIANGITEKNKELQRQAELARRRNPAPSSSSNTKYPTADEITKVEGFWVHIEIADNLQRMLDKAKSEGHDFGGWGYRDHASQIRLRKAHCGTSNYAVYSMPSSQCRPPTARPGASQHELGKAIDFTYGGKTIGTRSSAGFKWLNANANSFGFYNLPSEPWHWSVNGR